MIQGLETASIADLLGGSFVTFQVTTLLTLDEQRRNEQNPKHISNSVFYQMISIFAKVIGTPYLPVKTKY